jgi:antitoxin MazE
MKTKLKRKSPKRARRRIAIPVPATSAGGMRVKLVRIGNSRGIRLPKAVIEQAGLGDEMLLSVDAGRIILGSLDHPRAGWDKQISKTLAKEGNEFTDEDREWLNAPLSKESDEKEWTW